MRNPDRTGPGPTEEALRVDGVSYSYGSKPALKDVSFTVHAGSFAVLLGANGAGKTTLYSLTTRLFNTREGAIFVFGYKLRDKPSKALAKIGVVFQRQTLDMDLTVMQNLLYHSALHGMGQKAALSRSTQCMEKHEIAQFAQRKVHQLSGGQRRRVEIARALIHEPKLLLLDEPTVGLDIQSRTEFIAHVRRLCSEDNVSVLWSTHLIDEVENHDDLVVLHHGSVVDNGVVADVLKRTGSKSIGEAFNELTKSDE